MTQSIGDFHTTVRTWLKRGTALDDTIPTAVRMAARFLERNYTFMYMKQWFEVTVEADDRYITLPSNLFRQVNFFRFRNTENEFRTIRRINPLQQTSISEDTPSGFWRDGATRLILDAATPEELTGEVQAVVLTDWPTNLNSTHWLIDVAEDVLLAQTLMYSGFGQRDVAMYQMYKTIRDEGLQTLVQSEQEAEYSGTDDVMLYTPDTDSDWTFDGR